MKMRVQYRPRAAGISIGSQQGLADVPLLVRKSRPSLWPTQMTSGRPVAMAMALMGTGLLFGPARTGTLIACQRGPDCVGFRGSFGSRTLGVLQRLIPPARSLSGQLGSSTKGAIKFVCPCPIIA